MAIRFRSSSDHGVTFPNATERIIDQSDYNTNSHLQYQSWRVYGTLFPKLESGPNPSNSSLYNVYVTYGARTTDNSLTGQDEADIFFSKSTDKGNTWLTNPTKINDDNTTTPQFFPSIAVNAGPDGVVDDLHVTYADMSGLSGSSYHIRYRQSDDAGSTWQASQKVTSAPSDPSGPNRFLGDYFDIAVAGGASNSGRVIAIWTDLRQTTNKNEDVWTAVSTGFTLTSAAYVLYLYPDYADGGSTGTTVTATLVGGPVASLSFSAAGWCCDVSFSPASATPTASSVVTFSIGPGHIFRRSITYNVVITASGLTSLSQSVTISVILQQNCFCVI
jgi:hypothetical protein